MIYPHVTFKSLFFKSSNDSGDSALKNLFIYGANIVELNRLTCLAFTQVHVLNALN